VLRPLQEFLSTSAAGGVVLLVAIAVALLWANSPFSGGYERFWATRFAVSLGSWGIDENLRWWVNDGLMAPFFLLVGLEIKRELLTGELRDRRAALLPAAAALGGMIVPAIIYLALNAGDTGSRAWVSAMPTDIVVALGILTLAGTAAPPSLKPFLLTLAIVDDILTVLAIAVFSSQEVRWMPLLVALGSVAVALGMQRIHVRASAVYVVIGLMLWIALQRSGVSPALAGVLIGFLTPAVAFQRPRAVSVEAHRTADDTLDDPDPPDVDAPHWLRLAALSREAVSPLARVEHLLLPWVTLIVLPLFALANAGMALSGGAIAQAVHSRVALGLVFGRIVGKLVGIVLACWILVRAGVASLPSQAGWPHMVGVGAAAAAAFSVSLLVVDLTLPVELQVVAKIGILASVVLGGTIALAVFRAESRQSS
jgi:NhaA family Na+:H+ antiporter